MDKLRIEGGRQLRGSVPVSGAKNAALPILAVGLLTAEPLVVRNVPRLHDVGTALRLLDVRRWSERSIISLVMQTVDNSLTVTGKRSRLGFWHLTTRQDESAPAPTYLPVAQDVVF